MIKSFFKWLTEQPPGASIHMNEITSLEDLEARIEASAETPLFLFKHSTSCPTSARAIRRVTDFIAEAPDHYPEIHLIKVIESRAISNAAAERLGVEHASPQLILVKDGHALWTTSHFNIQAPAIENAIKQHATPA